MTWLTQDGEEGVAAEGVVPRAAEGAEMEVEAVAEDAEEIGRAGACMSPREVGPGAEAEAAVRARGRWDVMSPAVVRGLAAVAGCLWSEELS